jgi:NAD(P)-dependent dehydrogenase (short-subunit alcohol dehydrogenase family)
VRRSPGASRRTARGWRSRRAIKRPAAGSPRTSTPRAAKRWRSGDVTDSGSIAETISAVAAKWNRIDILVNNAGLGEPTPLSDRDDSCWDAIVATNLTAVFRVTREALPHLSDGGRIINLSSVVGRFGVAGQGAYSATKHGVIGLTRTFALELAPRGVTVNAMCPGWVETDMGRAVWRRVAERHGGGEPEGREMAAKMAPLRRVIQPDEVAGLASYWRRRRRAPSRVRRS